jgi:hypothetical protein
VYVSRDSDGNGWPSWAGLAAAFEPIGIGRLAEDRQPARLTLCNMKGWMSVIAGAVGVQVCAMLGVGAAEELLVAPATTNFVAVPWIHISREPAGLSIVFAGALQSAESYGKPWQDVPDAVSPVRPDTTADYKFYRAREPDSVFAARSVIRFAVTGPFQSHFELAFAGTPDGFIPPQREKPFFDVRLTIVGYEIPATLRVRGNSSLQECPFPKLKFKVAKAQRVATPFVDAPEIKIGTHCAEGGRGTIGRLRDETAAFREALAYETMELLGFISPRVRRARIEYHDTTPTNGTSEVGWTITRNALILDDVGVVASRLGGRALDDFEIAALQDAGFDEQLVTDLLFLHTLLGNWDYRLSLDGRSLWNTEVIELDTGKLVPIAGDFDLSSWVTEVVRFSAPRDYRPELPDLDRQARYELEQIQKRVSVPSFAAASQRFVSQRAAITSQINTAEIDGPGRTNALHHVTAFFDALALIQ